MGRIKLANRPPLYNATEQREGLRRAGRFNAQLMDFVRPHVKEGVSTLQIDELVRTYTLDHRHVPACFGYRGYPKNCCTSINDVVCHGIPDQTVLKSGDIVNVDLTTIVDGWYGDSSETFLIGEVSDAARLLVQSTFESLYLGIKAAQPYNRVIDIGYAISRFAHQKRLGVVEKYQGHGVGRRFHQEPSIPHYPCVSARKDVIQPGMCFTIEPMLNLGSKETRPPEADGWTVRTEDASISAQFEHTILITEQGPEILTLTEKGPRPGHVF